MILKVAFLISLSYYYAELVVIILNVFELLRNYNRYILR